MQMIELPLNIERDKLKGKLERNKALRRAAIIAAARDLIRESGEAGLSMRSLAARSGVSLATPYNLFGSKQAIVIALTNHDALAFGKTLSGRQSTNSIARIFDFVDLSFHLYGSDPDYWRALLRILYRSEDADLRMRLRQPRSKFIKLLVEEAEKTGDLIPDVPADLLTRGLFGVYLYVVQEWVHGMIPLEHARLETDYGYSLLLLGVAADHTRPELIARRDRLREALDPKKPASSSKGRARQKKVDTTQAK